MIDLTVTGHAEPEQDRDEIARLLKEYGVGAVCLLRSGGAVTVKDIGSVSMVPSDDTDRYLDGRLWHGTIDINSDADIIRVFPPGTRLRVTVEVVE
jgi:hypothetical protein